MTTQQIADRLVELCRQGKSEQAYRELFADDAVAYEPEGVPDRKTKGLDNLLRKSQTFEENVLEMHDSHVTDAIVLGDYISLGMMIDMTSKDRPRMKLNEICVYHVKNGKIAEERFYFDTTGMMPPSEN